MLDLKRLDRISHELANRNACNWLYKTLAKEHGVNRRVSDPYQGILRNKINLSNYRINGESFTGFGSLPRNYTYGSDKGITFYKKNLNVNYIIVCKLCSSKLILLTLTP